MTNQIITCDHYLPIIIHVTQLVCQLLMMSSLEFAFVVNNVIHRRRNSSLSDGLRNQKEIIAISARHSIVDNSARNWVLVIRLAIDYLFSEESSVQSLCHNNKRQKYEILSRIAA